MEAFPDKPGKTILMVGGAHGIGRETCRLLSNPEVQLIVADRDQAGLEALGKELGTDVATVPLDLADEESISRAVNTLAEKHPHLDVVVICAAVHSAYPAEYLPDEHIEEVIKINLTGHIKLVRDVLPLLKTGGRLIGLSSNCAEIGIPMESIYAASKAGLERFYEALSIELSYRRIRPILIQPGNVNTGFNETGNTYAPTGNEWVDRAYGKVLTAIDSRHGIAPEKVAAAIVHAIHTTRPRIGYIVGMNAIKAHWAKRLLGTGRALKLLARHFRL